MLSPIALLGRGFFRQLWRLTIHVLQMRFLYRPSLGRRPAMFRPRPSGTFRSTSPNASPKILASRSAILGQTFTNRAASPKPDSETSKPRSSISFSRTVHMNWPCCSAWSVEWGGTGATDSGLATPWSTLTPTFNFGKGFGDLPESAGWLRAFAVTGQVGYQFPTRSFDVAENAFIPQVLVYGGSIQYSMPYLKSEIHDYQLPDFINHLIPIVEAQFTTPIANNFGNSPITIGTINPGVIWVGTYFQVGAEAVFPVNRASGTGVGFLGQLHIYLDDIFPTTIGRPLLGGSSTPPQKLSF